MIKRSGYQLLRSVEVRPGVRRRTFSGQGATLAWTELAPGHEPRPHTHAHEQIVYLVKGRVRFTVGGEEVMLGAGDMIVVPGGAEHFAETVGDEVSVDLSVFTPVRQDYVAQEVVHDGDAQSARLGLAPSKVIATHRNYRGRALELGEVPEYASYFLKPPSSVAAGGHALVRPGGCSDMVFEGEVALIVGERARGVAPEDGWSYVRWVTAANDVGLLDLRYADRGSNLRSKGADGFTPLGPSLLDARELDPEALHLQTWLNGTLVQDAVSSDMLFSCGYIIADLSRLMTLEPGDVILTGTPAGAGRLLPGDVVEVEVSCGAHSTGRLQSPVHEGEESLAPWGCQPRSEKRGPE